MYLFLLIVSAVQPIFLQLFFQWNNQFQQFVLEHAFFCKDIFFSFEYAYIPQFITVCLLNQAINAIVVSLRVYFSPKRVSKFDCHDNIQVLLVLSLSKCLLKVQLFSVQNYPIFYIRCRLSRLFFQTWRVKALQLNSNCIICARITSK